MTFTAPIVAGIICGVLDGLAAIIITLSFGGTVPRMFQGIAAGVLGRDAFQGGTNTVMLGIALHFVIAFGAATVYFIASRLLPILIDQALLMGVLYGVLVHLVMQYIVLPMSKIGSRPFNARSFIAVLAAHVIVVGPSIALTIRRFAKS
jgi:hypothetical protein